jgi:hypothetical protein
MQVELIPLSELRETVKALTRPKFLERYPGCFLLAMGLLEVDQIEARVKSAQAGKEDPTRAVSFRPELKHDLAESHPLAGMAFFVTTTGSAAEVEIGRSKACDVTIPDRSISDHHCSLQPVDGTLFIVDNGSTNGTNINLQAIPTGEPRELVDEDIISIGRYSFQLLSARAFFGELSLLAAMDAWDD